MLDSQEEAVEIIIQETEVPNAAFDDMIEVDENTNTPIMLIVLMVVSCMWRCYNSNLWVQKKDRRIK